MRRATESAVQEGTWPELSAAAWAKDQARRQIAPRLIAQKAVMALPAPASSGNPRTGQKNLEKDLDGVAEKPDTVGVGPASDNHDHRARPVEAVAQVPQPGPRVRFDGRGPSAGHTPDARSVRNLVLAPKLAGLIGMGAILALAIGIAAPHDAHRRAVVAVALRR